jgi:hypothetical protein
VALADVAAIVLRADDLTGFRMQFCEIPKQLAKSRTTKSEGSLILFGYPTDRIFAVSQTKTANAEANYFAVRPTILAATIAKPPSEALSSRYDPKRDVLVHNEPNDPKMEPYGFSGAAAWSERPERSGQFWSVDRSDDIRRANQRVHDFKAVAGCGSTHDQGILGRIVLVLRSLLMPSAEAAPACYDPQPRGEH